MTPLGQISTGVELIVEMDPAAGEILGLESNLDSGTITT